LNITDYEAYLKKSLSPKRFEHSLGVMRTMDELALVHGLDQHQARLAGLLHDAAKEFSPDQWLALIRQDEQILQDARIYDYDHYLHGPVGAMLVERELGIEDEEVLRAIATHGYYGAWEHCDRPLGWCLRFADILEPGRDWSNNDWLNDLVLSLREAAYGGRLTDAALMLTQRVSIWYEAVGIPVHPNLRRAAFIQ
jgi:predicted HD superfamily hydrolase involved in NAD metabolism